MKYISLCDGIGAAHLAFQPLGWECLGVSEIDPYCNAVVRHHWGFENLGGMDENETIAAIKETSPDLIIGGTPCQSFSIAGKRRGIEADNGQLILWFLHAIHAASPRCFIWENVPGAYSIDYGAVLKAFVWSLAAIGYSVEWAIFNAQYFGVAQKRRRVFLVGYKGAPRAASDEVFFECQASKRNPPKGGKKKQKNKGAVANCIATCCRNSDAGAEIDNLMVDAVASCITAGGRKADRGQNETNLIVDTVTAKWAKGSGGPAGDECQNLTVDFLQEIDPTLIASDGGVTNGYVPLVAERIGVRRLTPKECERLMGFPDEYTLVPLRTTKKGRVIMTSDSARYKMIGNSIAVPVLKWIGERLVVLLNDSEK